VQGRDYLLGWPVDAGYELKRFAGAGLRVELAVATSRVGAVDSAVDAFAGVDTVSIAGGFAHVLIAACGSSAVAGVSVADVAKGAVIVGRALGSRLTWGAGFRDAIAVTIAVANETFGAWETVIAKARLFAVRAKIVSGAVATRRTDIGACLALITRLNGVTISIAVSVAAGTALVVVVLNVEMTAGGHRQ